MEAELDTVRKGHRRSLGQEPAIEKPRLLRSGCTSWDADNVSPLLPLLKNTDSDHFGQQFLRKLSRNALAVSGLDNAITVELVDVCYQVSTGRAMIEAGPAAAGPFHRRAIEHL